MSAPRTIALDMPALTAEQADLVASFIDLLHAALWQTYGDEILDLAADTLTDHRRPVELPLGQSCPRPQPPPLTPPDIATAPQLAILAAVDAALDIAETTLLAEHPALWDQDRPPWRPLDPTDHAANTITLLAGRLREALEQYRRAVDQHLAALAPAASDDIPF